jgi:hypothetical protein
MSNTRNQPSPIVRPTATQPDKSKYPNLNRGQQRFEFEEESDCQIENQSGQSSYLLQLNPTSPSIQILIEGNRGEEGDEWRGSGAAGFQGAATARVTTATAVA